MQNEENIETRNTINNNYSTNKSHKVRNFIIAFVIISIILLIGASINEKEKNDGKCDICGGTDYVVHTDSGELCFGCYCRLSEKVFK